MSVHYKYTPDETNIIVLSYVDNCVYWYTFEALGKWFLDTLIKRFHVKFLGFSHRFMLITISLIKDSSISVNKDRYTTSILTNYLNTDIVKTNTKLYKTASPFKMVFTNDYVSTSDYKVEKLTRKFNIHYKACIV